MVMIRWIRTLKLLKIDSMGRNKNRNSCTHRQAILNCVYSFQVKHSLPLGLKVWKMRLIQPEATPAYSRMEATASEGNLPGISQPLGDPTLLQFSVRIESGFPKVQWS